jgi:hypothetical protein
MSIIDDVKKVEDVVVKGAEDVKKELELIFGKQGVDAFLTAAENLLKTEAGRIIKVAVTAAKDALPNGPGAILHGIASAFAGSALKAAGISVGTQILNLAIEAVLSGTAAL